MRIEEIARLAGVSISTVSKIVNGKDQGIHPNTRERVLKIVKEYNYTPYASVIQNKNAKSFTLGVLSPDIQHMQPLLAAFVQSAQSQGYSVMVCDSSAEPEEELRSITRLCKHRVDGLLWQPREEKSLLYLPHLQEAGIPLFLWEPPFPLTDTTPFAQVVEPAYGALARTATQGLIDKGHRAIYCLGHPHHPGYAAFVKGYETCLFENHVPLPPQLQDEPLQEALLLGKATAFVCMDADLAVQLYWQAQAHNLHLPQDYSLVALLRDDSQQTYEHLFAHLRLPLQPYGAQLAQAMTDVAEKRPAAPPAPLPEVLVENAQRIGVPYNLRSKKIVVVGSLNMDVLINIEDTLKFGRTVLAHNLATIPGGKGLNQAVGVSRLGGNACLIGKVGRDYDGAAMVGVLTQAQVQMSGVATVDTVATGKAYINIRSDGESSIVVYAGANAQLSPQDIQLHENLFENAGYCLLPMETPLQTVMEAARTAQKHGVKIVVKPTTLEYISDQLLAMTDIFVPNRKEAAALCRSGKTPQEQADYFLSKGVQRVIITLGDKGCYVKTADYSQWFPAAKVKVLDTTGGADAFIAGLVTYLSEREDLPAAVAFATCAAGLCVTRLGVVPALPDRTTLELYLNRSL